MDGAITIDMVNAHQSSRKAIPLKPSLNKSTGKEMTIAQLFNEANWGSATHAYAISVQWLKPKHMVEIMQMAESFMHDSNTKTQQATADMDPNNICANIVDLDDDSEGSSTECK